MNDKTVPQNVEAEQALLGAIFVNNEAFYRVANFLTAAHFYEPLNRRIWEVCADHIRAGKSATPVTVKTFLPADAKVGDMTVSLYLAKLAAEAVTVIQAADYGRLIYDLADRRRCMTIGQDLIEMAIDAPVEKSGDQIAGEFVEKLATIQAESPKASGPGTARAAVQKIKEQLLAQKKAPCVSLPLPQLREVMGGDLEAGNLYGLLSSSGEGKTSLLLQVLDHAAQLGHPVLLLSYDQSPEQCIDQIVSQRTGIENTRIRERTMMEREYQRYYDALGVLADLPFEVRKCSARDDGSVQIASYARRFISRNPGTADLPPLIALDHVRKVKPKRENDHEGRIAAEVNGVCKDIASAHGAVWLNLNQRNGFGMRRKNPRPIAADVFGGEQGIEDYDGMFYLYRAEKYLKSQLATAEDTRDEEKIRARFFREQWEEGQAEVGALKVRFGSPNRRFRLRFEAEYTRYISLRSEPEPAFEGFA